MRYPPQGIEAGRKAGSIEAARPVRDASESPARSHHLASVQRAIGNRATRELLRSGKGELPPVQRQARGPSPIGPLVDSAIASYDANLEARLRRDLFSRGGSGSWSRALPAAPRSRLTFVSGEANRTGIGQRIDQRPEVRVPRRGRVGAARTDAQRVAIATINARLARQPTPAAGGEMTLHQRRGRGSWGWAYRAASHEAHSPEAAEHTRFMASQRDGHDMNLRTAEDRRRWAMFRFVLGTEGDTSAINAYDNQRVTIGAGFSARFGRAQAVYRRMPAAFHQELYDIGVEVTGEGFRVLDLNRGVVETGRNAEIVLQADERRLGRLARLAQSTEQMRQGGHTAEARVWMLRAQFDEATASIPRVVLRAPWTTPGAKLAMKINHWQTGVAAWRRLVAWAGPTADVGNMASQARDAIWRHHGRPAAGDYSLASIEARLDNRAALAGTRIRWRPRPAEPARENAGND